MKTLKTNTKTDKTKTKINKKIEAEPKKLTEEGRVWQNLEENSVFKDENEPFIDYQIERQIEDLQNKMNEIINDDEKIVDNIEKPSQGDSKVKFYSNVGKTTSIKEKDSMYVGPLNEDQIIQTKTNVYTNKSDNIGNYTEKEISEYIYELMAHDGLSYLDAKALIFDKIKRKEILKKNTQPQTLKPKEESKSRNQIQQSNIKISPSTKIYKNVP